MIRETEYDYASFMSPKSPRSTRTVEPPTPLTPCLVQRCHTSGSSFKTTTSTSTSTALASAATSTTPPPHAKHARRISLPPSPTIPRENVVTIPLRSCCEDCMPITEECIKEGDAWREKFTRAARRRRRSASLDSRMSEDGKGSGFLAAVNVDEVDKIRKGDHSHTSHSHPHKGRAAMDMKPDSPPANVEVNIYHPSPIALENHHKSHHHSSSSVDAQELALNPSPIPELEDEDEDDQLFPLPSPRRTPTASPVPSPNTSTSALAGVASATNSSKDSLQSSNGSSSHKGSDTTSCESSKGRGSRRCEKGLLTPDGSPNVSPSSTQFTKEGSGDVEVLRGFPPLTGTRLTARNTISKSISPLASSPVASPVSSSTYSNCEERPTVQIRTPSSSPQGSRHRTQRSSLSLVVDALKGVSAMSSAM